MANAVDAAREAAVVASDEDRGPVLTTLGLALRACYEADNSPETLTEAIGILRSADVPQRRRPSALALPT